MKSIWSNLLKLFLGDPYHKLESLIDEMLTRQRNKSHYWQARPWFVYIELSDIVIMFEDYEKIFKHIGLIDILYARSQNNTEFKILPQLKEAEGLFYCDYTAKFVVFACGDFYIACIPGSRHILVIDNNAYRSCFSDGGFKSRASYIKIKNYIPNDEFELVYQFYDHFDLQVNFSSYQSIYYVDCTVRGIRLQISSSDLERNKFIYWTSKLRSDFFCLQRIVEGFKDSKIPTWYPNLIEKRHKNHTETLSIKITIPHDLLTC